MALLSYCMLIVFWLLAVLRLWVILPTRTKALFGLGNGTIVRKNCNSVGSTMVVLGSGGHTTEMLKLLTGFDRQAYKRFTFVVAKTDSTSMHRVRSSKVFRQSDSFRTIPRSREVGQSWISTIVTTLISFFACFKSVVDERPDLLLCNGPGTCIPVCACIVLLRFIGLLDTKIVFCESFARVKGLSLSGKILFFLTDRFVVQWPQLAEKYPSTHYIGAIC